MEKRLIHQQGDVLLYKVARIPANAKPVKSKAGRYILAEGEATGHAHAIADTPQVELFERNGTLYLRVSEGAPPLVHEEHKQHNLQPGVFEVGQVKEVDPFTEEVRRVAD